MKYDTQIMSNICFCLAAIIAVAACIVLIFSWSTANAQDYCTKKKIREFNSLYHPEKQRRRPLYRYPVVIIIEEDRGETARERRDREWNERPFSRQRVQGAPDKQEEQPDD